MVSSSFDTLEQRAALIDQLAHVPQDVRRAMLDQSLQADTEQHASVAQLHAPRKIVMVRGRLIVGRRITDRPAASPDQSPVVFSRAAQIAQRMKHGRRHDDHQPLLDARVAPREVDAATD